MNQPDINTDAEECPHCPDGHTPPTGGAQPWCAWVASERDGDGQPMQIVVARSAGAHVAESDAQWVRDCLNAPAEQRADRAAFRKRIADAIGSTMLLGLRDVDEPGDTERIRDWIKWISETVAALPAPVDWAHALREARAHVAFWHKTRRQYEIEALEARYALPTADPRTTS